MSSSINHRPQDDDDVLSINRMLKHLNDINPGEVITYARVAANQILPTAVMSQARGLYLLGKVHLPQRVSHPTNARDEEVAGPDGKITRDMSVGVAAIAVAPVLVSGWHLAGLGVDVPRVPHNEEKKT